MTSKVDTFGCKFDSRVEYLNARKQSPDAVFSSFLCIKLLVHFGFSTFCKNCGTRVSSIFWTSLFQNVAQFLANRPFNFRVSELSDE